MCKYIYVISRETMRLVYLSRSLMPSNNTPVYSLLGLPLLKYISHIPKAPFNTEKCKEKEGESFFFYPYSYSRYTMIPWELPGTLRGGREQWHVLSQFYRYPVAIGVAVLVNNCFLWQNSGSSSDSQWRQVRSSFEIRNKKVLREDELRKLQSQKKDTVHVIVTWKNK